MSTVAVLITCYNRKEKTLQCLECLRRQILPRNLSVDVYLTDDCCTDGTPEAVREQFPQVKVIHSSGDLYWNRGMHLAWETAAKTRDYDYYLWLNDDTFVFENMLSTLLDAAVATNNKAIIVGPTKSTLNNVATYGGRLSTGEIPPVNGSLTCVNTFNGNIVLIPNTVYKKLGNLDYYFTHSKGDFDYGLRARKAGIDAYQVGQFLGNCESHESLDAWCNPDVPLKKRWRLMYRPNGMPPREIYYLERRHKGLVSAVFHYLTVHIRCILPILWQLK